MTRFAFLGRVSTEDNQDPEVSRGWQLDRAKQLIAQVDGVIVAEYFDVGQSRAVPWKRRPQASALLEAIKDPKRPFGAVVIGEPQRAFYGNQFSLTFPVLAHYGIQLWVPEVGGRVDPGSDSHDMLMTMFGGMSKAERTRIRSRTKTAMTHLATQTDRFLGGRPPYGYQLVDAGPHPHPAKAAEGKRLRRLEADPVTAPVVQRIFAMYAAGAGLRTIAEALAQEGIASPAAHDPARNRHRDTSGWSHSAVLNIVKNPTYSGYRVWGKQHKQDVLVDPGDVAAGYQARMRWTDEQDWIRSEHQTHPALVDTEVLKKAQARLRDGKTNTQALRPTARGRIYPLRGLIECGACGHRMQGIYKPPRSAGAAERYIYRCELRKQRSLPPDAFPDHPNVLTVRQAALLPLIDQWLTSLAVPATFTQLPDDAAIVTAQADQIRQELAALDDHMANLIGLAAQPGTDVPELAAAIRNCRAERDNLAHQLEVLRAQPRLRLDPVSLASNLKTTAAALADATPQQRWDLYQAVGLHLTYHHTPTRTIDATIDTARIAGLSGNQSSLLEPVTAHWNLEEDANRATQ